MRKGFFLRLALTNIRKNKETYIPYILSCIGCVAMTYMMFFIFRNPGMDNVRGSSDVRTVVSFGIVIICIFSVIFLLYSNSFLIKRRQKGLGLYNILGMEKGHISRMMSVETILTSLLSLTAGILAGILGSKLALLLLLKLAHMPAQFGFFVSPLGIMACILLYGGIFFLTWLNNIRKVHVSQPIELLRGGNVGEKEPKAKWLMALAGFICLGCGYYIAVTTESPLEAIGLFFVAVLLVMAGTYLLFTTGSIAVLKIMRWKKSFYYKMKNFTSISGMIYRMKQNAVGLASICILSTGVLLMLSATVSLNFGIEDTMQARYPYDVNLSLRHITREEGEEGRKVLAEALEKERIPYEHLADEMTLSTFCKIKERQIVFGWPDDMSDVATESLYVIPASEFKRSHGQDAGIKPGQVLVYRNGKSLGQELKVMDVSYQVKQWLKEWPMAASKNLLGSIAIVVTEKDYAEIERLQKEALGEDAGSLELDIGIDIKGTKENQVHYGNRLADYFTGVLRERLSKDALIVKEIRQENYESFYVMNGGLLFLGIFLGGLFLMGAAMIIYYKQVSEGYEDKERFEIMQKVGMSRKEVKSSIRRQILMVFFTPLIMAALHIAMAFPMVKRLLLLFGMANNQLFILCTVVTIVLFAAVYGIIYSLTARSYYKIVEGQR